MHELAHIPVLADEVIEALDPKMGHLYCDGTVGWGGHSGKLLELSSPDGRLVGIDRDPDALDAAQHNLAAHGERVVLTHGRFGDIDDIVARLVSEGQLDEGERFHGMLLDIGPSSPQFDRADRGFSFSRSGPIDMRMDPSSGETALQLMRRLSPDELTTVIREYGEERYAGRIAERIKDALRSDRLRTTTDLAELVEGALPARLKRQMKIHPATRTFQALRIAVNDELGELRRFLDVFPDLLAPGGRCAIISFHSLEDRMVKRCFRELAKTSSLPPHLAEQAGERIEAICVPLVRKPIVASEAEVAKNPRARSARLRACQKVAA